MHRLGVPYNEPISHPQKTVNAMRLLAAITDNSLRVLVSHALYKVECSQCVHCSLDLVDNHYFQYRTISCAGLLV